MALEEQLDLNADDAFRQIDRIEQALTQAASSFRVDLARAVRVLDQAVTVDVNADVTGITGQVDAAVDAADSTVTVTAETVGIDSAEREVEQLGEEVEEAEAKTGRLRDALSGLAGPLGLLAGAVGVRETFQFLSEAVDVASTLGESQSKANTVFGESIDVVQRFADTAAEGVGLANDQALEFTGTFGNLFQAMGVAREEAAALSPEVVQLGADLASFNNLEVTDALEKLRSGLVGEVEPLRSMGISFNAAQVEAKALELGLADLSGEISEGAKLQARWAIISEQSSIAAGDFARTSGGLANQQRILAADIRNAMAAIGQQLLPFVLRLVEVTRGELLPTFTDLAVTAMPILVRMFDALSPAMGASLTILEALTPVLGIIATVLEAIPDPLLQMATMFLAVRTALGPLTPMLTDFLRGAGSIGPALSRGLSGVGGALTGLLTPMGLVSVAIGGAITLLADYNQKKAEQKRRIDEVADAFTAENAVVEDVTTQIAKLRAETSNQIDDLRRLGLSFEDFADLAAGGEDELRRFIERLIRAGEIDPQIGNGVDEQVDAITQALLSNSEAMDGVVGGNRGLITTFLRLRTELQGGAKSAIETKVAMEELSDAEAEAAIKANTAKDGTVDYVGALDDLEEAERKAAIATQQRATALGPATVAGDRYTNSTERLRDAAAEAALAMADHVGAFEGISGAYLEFGDRAGELIDLFARGKVSADDMALAMASYGFTIDELLTIQDEVAESVGEFVDEVVGGLDSLQSIVQSIGEDEGIADFVARFEKQATDLANFVDNIAKLVERGADDLAAALAQAGPDASKAAAEAVKASDKELGKLEERYTGTANHLDAANRRMAETAPLLADNWQRATDRIEGVSPPDLASGISESLDQAAAVFEVEVGPNGDIVVSIKAGGVRVGEAFGEGFVEGIGNLSPHVGAAAAAMGMTAEEYARSILETGSPSRVAARIGRDFVLGFAQGLEQLDPVVAAAERVATAVATSAAVTPVVPAFSTAAPTVAVAPVSAAQATTGGNAGTVAAAPTATIQIGPNYETRIDPVQVAAQTSYLFAEATDIAPGA